MGEREGDIEFDFFEESETREGAAEERPRRRGRPPVRPPTGLTPLLRLIGLISFAILIVLLLIFWVNSCRESQRKDAYKNYVKDMSTLATDSQRLGRQFNLLLTTKGKKESDVEAELTGLAQQQKKNIADRARAMQPPGRLRKQHEHAVEAFDLRVSGLDGMARAFKSTAASKNADFAGANLASQMKRLVASDVVWEDLFRDPTKLELKRQGITGVQVPDSLFLPNSDIATTASMKLAWQRIHGASTGSGGSSCSPHGTMIVSTKVLPANKDLSTSTLNTIKAGTNLRFSVTVQDSGCAQEVGIPVRLSIQQSGKPITAKQMINVINPGESKPVIFSVTQLPPLDQNTTITVEVSLVPHEQKIDNNTATYPARFSVP
jgi:hypothetical protein